MKTQTKDAGKEQRIVLNLNMTQARALDAFIEVVWQSGTINSKEITKIQQRIQKTIKKHEGYQTQEEQLNEFKEAQERQDA